MSDRNRVYVGNLPPNMEADEIEDFLGCKDVIKNIDVKRGRDGTYTYAFVTLETEKDAE